MYHRFGIFLASSVWALFFLGGEYRCYSPCPNSLSKPVWVWYLLEAKYRWYWFSSSWINQSDLYSLKKENTDDIELFLTGAAAKSHSCRSSSDLFAEALALSCFYKSAYLLFDMIGFEKCLWTVKSWKQYTIQRQQLKRQKANSKATLQISAEFTYFSNFEKKTFVNRKFAPKKNKLWQFVQFVNGSFCVAAAAKADLIFVTNITNYIRGEKIVMWRNFSFPCMTIVGKFLHMWRNFSKIDGVSMQFMVFCC